MENSKQAKKNYSTRNKIIIIAESLFSKFSYASVTMDAVASAANITKPALYYYFQSKEELFIKMVEQIFKNFNNALDKILKKQITLEKKFKELAMAYVKFSIDKKDLGPLIMQKFSKKDKKLIKLMGEFKQKMIDQLEPLIKEVLILTGREKKMDSRLITVFLIGSLNSIVASKVKKDKYAWMPEKAIDQLASLIFFIK